MKSNSLQLNTRSFDYSPGIRDAFSPHRYILREIWGPKSEEDRQYLRVYVTHLRQKIESDPANPSLVITEPGIGYRFISPD